MKVISLKSFAGMLLAVASVLSVSGVANAQSASAGAQGKTDVLWFGQAGFRIKSPQGKMILIDPWITGGPKTPPQYKNDLQPLDPLTYCL
jgi:hypothetical protein